MALKHQMCLDNLGNLANLSDEYFHREIPFPFLKKGRKEMELNIP